MDIRPCQLAFLSWTAQIAILEQRQRLCVIQWSCAQRFSRLASWRDYVTDLEGYKCGDRRTNSGRGEIEGR
jgi:hypothetical protein